VDKHRGSGLVVSNASSYLSANPQLKEMKRGRTFRTVKGRQISELGRLKGLQQRPKYRTTSIPRTECYIYLALCVVREQFYFRKFSCPTVARELPHKEGDTKPTLSRNEWRDISESDWLDRMKQSPNVNLCARFTI
jgi:hypothetical protein